MDETRVREVRMPASEAPAAGEIKMLDIGGRRVGLFSINGHLYALADRCPHRGAPLCSHGEIVSTIDADNTILHDELALVRCPWHKWDFDVTSGRCIVDERLRVRRYRVRHTGDEIVVSLEQPES
jgi:3-phenylpropionate/trans-cinnamate dioxygenase ferredoxin subunit